MQDIKIFTNFRGDGDKNWLPHLDFYPPPAERAWLNRVPFIGGYLHSALHALKMYRQRHNYDLALLAGTRAGNMFGVIQSCLPGKKIPIFYFSNLWDVNEHKPLYWLKWCQIYLMNKVAIGFALNSSYDAIPYARYYPVPIEKFICLPYFATLWKYDYQVRDENYVFSGGNGQRDYRQLIEAARGLPHKVFIATTDRKLIDGVELPPNVTVEGVSNERFRTLMAGATIHVVAMAGGYLRSGGHQTYINGMAMKKPVIVTDRRGASDYIEDGVDGYLLEPGDIQGLRGLIEKLMSDPQLRKQVGERAGIKSKRFDGSLYLKNLREVACNAWLAAKAHRRVSELRN